MKQFYHQKLSMCKVMAIKPWVGNNYVKSRAIRCSIKVTRHYEAILLSKVIQVKSYGNYKMVFQIISLIFQARRSTFARSKIEQVKLGYFVIVYPIKVIEICNKLIGPQVDYYG